MKVESSGVSRITHFGYFSVLWCFTYTHEIAKALNRKMWYNYISYEKGQ